MDFSNTDIQTFLKVVRKVAREECLKVLDEKNIERILYGVITTDKGENTYDVLIAGMDVPITVKNKSAQTIAVGDAVIVKAISSNLGNAYIALKMG